MAVSVLGVALVAAPALTTTDSAQTPGPWFSGKQTTVTDLPTDCRYHDLINEPGYPGPPAPTELRELYLRLHLPRASGPRRVEARFVRANGDATANTRQKYDRTRASIPFTVLHLEQGEGRGGRWQVRACGPGTITIHTRYAKRHTP